MESILENKLMTMYKDEMILFMKSNPEHFEEAIQLAISDKQPYAWRAAFLLSGCMDENDKRVKKHILPILKCIKQKKDGHQRELLKILSNMKISEKHEGQIFDICINLWKQINKAPSVRMNALKFVVKIAKKYPELSEEIVIVTQNHYLESLSPGVKHSIKKLIKDEIQQKQHSQI